MFKLDLLTPNGVVIKDLECNDITIPTTRGIINVLPEHTHILTTLSTGPLTVKSESGTKVFSVTHGTCKVLGNKVSILAITSEAADKIDTQRAKAAKERAEKKLSGGEALDDTDLLKYQRKLERAKLRLELAYLK